MIRSVVNLVRLLRAARILARHDALFMLERLDVAPGVVIAAKALQPGRDPVSAGLRPGQRLARALQDLGPSAIKLGQALSTRSDLLGEEMAADLSELQDRLPPFPGADAKAIVARELGKPVEDLFQSFDETAIAAASIAQVHFAVTKDGAPVAVKVLRPNVEAAFRKDFELFYWVARLIERARPELRRLKPVAAIRALEETVELEQDLRFEAAAATELAENFAGDAELTVPAVYWQLTARRVLTTDRVDGIPIDEVDALTAAGHDPTAILEKAATAFFKMLFRDGFFHGDLHPGNLFVQANGTLAAVDFGIMGRVDRRTRRHLAEMLVGFLTGDYRKAAKIHFDAGWVPPDKSLDTFTQACRSIGEPILGRPQSEISMAQLLAQLFQITELFDMETQPQLLLLQKTMLVAEGTGRSLNPNINMWFLAQPLIEDWIKQNLGPQARARDAASDLGAVLERLPRTLSNVERAAALFVEAAEQRNGGLSRHRAAPLPIGAIGLGITLLLILLVVS
ncbi:MAG: 2-polyprenylphenol 6-hydroxylase [Magnetospiraceae bacterium]